MILRGAACFQCERQRERGGVCAYPVDQMSTALPWPVLLRTSGAT